MQDWIRLDRESATLVAGGRIVRVTQTEMLLIDMLLAARGGWVMYSHIHEEMCRGSLVGITKVDMHVKIHLLRSKLEQLQFPAMVIKMPIDVRRETRDRDIKRRHNRYLTGGLRIALRAGEQHASGRHSEKAGTTRQTELRGRLRTG